MPQAATIELPMSNIPQNDDPIAERRDEVLKRMLNTPPRPHKPKEERLSESRPATPPKPAKPS